MYMRPRTPASPLVVLVLILVCWPFVTTVVYLSRLPQPGDQLVQGHIINMEVKTTIIHQYSKFRSEPIYSYNSYTTYLTIKIVNTDTIVKTFVHEDWTGKAPEVVRFYYSGDPTKMVFLQEDMKALDDMIFAWELVGIVLIVPIVILMLLHIILYMPYKKRAATIRANEFSADNRDDQYSADANDDKYSDYTSDDEVSRAARQEEFDAFLKKLDKS